MPQPTPTPATVDPRSGTSPRIRAVLATLAKLAGGAILTAVGVFALTSDAVGLTVLGTVLAAFVALVGLLVLAQVVTLLVLRAVSGGRPTAEPVEPGRPGAGA